MATDLPKGEGWLRASCLMTATLIAVVTASCDPGPPRVPVASTAGPVEISFVNVDGDSENVINGPELVDEDGGDIGIGAYAGGSEPDFCDPDFIIPTDRVRVVNPETGETLFSQSVKAFPVCPDDRLLWDGTELRRLEPDESWPPEVTMAD